MRRELAADIEALLTAPPQTPDVRNGVGEARRFARRDPAASVPRTEQPAGRDRSRLRPRHTKWASFIALAVVAFGLCGLAAVIYVAANEGLVKMFRAPDIGKGD